MAIHSTPERHGVKAKVIPDVEKDATLTHDGRRPREKLGFEGALERDGPANIT
jgi:hypothetical protein